ncbi:protein tyrosine phosphatase domain-containing protein 1 [Xyrichtys novacula]|uniref:Protein tyrosine phosphatase domain-containing protein 1 n=1 Tax=Xyrichtys novacula TaxID=13765 RepID=A0AAV1F772_XYRNO|nr:protein tyrosine phosphatase domain-containing protein 1 [Xyrichtys novacula]
MPTLTPHIPVPRPSYSQTRENLVKAIPPKLLCLLACGGPDCRYEGPECWKLNQQVIRGVFSSWVTDDIIAMARPSNRLIEKYNIIEQFQRLNIRSIINMQLPGEHAHCGPPLDPQSGFTYTPQIFMDNDIYFYNFGMPDFGVSSLVVLVDAVKVLAFAVKEGRVGVHCHAGLGRTGVLIACYLIYMLRISPSEAVHYVRIKRPRSIQTRAQISQVFDFARLISSQLVQYPDLSLRHGVSFTLQHYLNRQAWLLHGQEARTLRHTPKVVYLLLVRLSCLALGPPAPPEVVAELEKKSALRSLGRMVRETLTAKQYLPLLEEGHKSSWVDTDSVSSWDQPLGFLERRGDVVLYKRSFSDSDLSKRIENKVQFCIFYPAAYQAHKVSKSNCLLMLCCLCCILPLKHLERSFFFSSALRNEEHRCVKDLIQPGLRSAYPIHSSGHQATRKESDEPNLPQSKMTWSRNYTKLSTSMAQKALTKSSSNIEVTVILEELMIIKTLMHALKSLQSLLIKLCRNSGNPGPTVVARAVAKAMSDQTPPGENVLQRSALLQEELNSSDSGWALLVTESDPHVLSCLLWTWLDRLREPVLSAEDVVRLSNGANNRKPLSVLKKAQRHTIYCLLGCVRTVSSLCPHREDALLSRLMRTLTRRPQEEMESLGILMKVLKVTLSELYHNYGNLTRTCSTNVSP